MFRGLQAETRCQQAVARSVPGGTSAVVGCVVAGMRLLTSRCLATISLTTISTDRRKWFRLFNLLLLLSAANFLLYKYFSRSEKAAITWPSFQVSGQQHLHFMTLTVANNTRNAFRAYSNLQLDHNNNGSSFPATNMDFKKQNSKVSYREDNREAADATLSDAVIPEILPPIQNSPPSHESRDALLTTSIGSLVKASESSNLSPCPLVPPGLQGPLATYTEPISWEQIASQTIGLEPGGRFKPSKCEARNRVAIVIPYRNREQHLKILLSNLHPMLSRQQHDYGIFVVDQALPGIFNRGMLMNIGYVEAMKRYNYQCAVFHDVDLIPENDRNIYSCPEMPRHLSVAIDKFGYRLPYSSIYGGVSVISRQQFEAMNGFSNMFFGWGGEDDDMAMRITRAGYTISRFPITVARYKMMKHIIDSGNEQNPMRFALLKNATARNARDGINSLVYQVQIVEALPTHLRIQVLIKEEDILKGLQAPS